jgi:hypothetical protein
MEPQLRQCLAAAKLEILHNEIAFRRGGKRGLLGLRAANKQNDSCTK